jgi:hypothetical protein
VSPKNWGKQWATAHIAELRAGKTVSFRPHGRSMEGKIESGQLCTVSPVDPSTLKRDDIVLCKVNGFQYLHLVKDVGKDGRFLIGNNKGRINGWISAEDVYGRLVKVEP